MIKNLSKNLQKQQNRVQKYSFLKKSQKNFSSAKRVRDGTSDVELYSNLKVGDQIHNFKLLKIEQISDFQLTAYHLQHENTDTQFLHIDSPQDLNNCMAIIFKTIPNNDKGTPHILEHLACCGGEKFPVRDPFMKMLKRSLNTYMNAWTGPDFTAYPFSSQNKKDFENLRDVYMDISLNSLLKKTDFLQEGWRYDFNQNNELEYKGVVFNEMKGVFQTQDSILAEQINKHLFKNSIYNHSSGGNPPDITDLSYEEVKEFYQTFYHPSNAKIFSYGDLDFKDHLKYLDETYFSTQFQRQNPVEPIKLSETLSEPKTDLVFTGPPETLSMDPEAQCKLGFTFLCNEVLNDPIETLGLQVLSYLLFQQPNGPLYKALIEKGVAPTFISGNGYESFSLQGNFTIGVSGIKEEQAQEIEELIFKVLKHESTFDEEIIESVIHMIELDTKVPKSNFGLNILMQVLNAYNHNSEKSLQSLNVTENLQQLRQKILNENFLENLTEKYLLNNKHYIRYKMLPDEDYNKKVQEQELQKLKEIQNNLSQEQIQEIKTINQQLSEEQDAVEDNVDLLPSLQLKDVEIKVEDVQFEKINIDGSIPLYFTKQATNGVTYLKMKIDMGEIPLYIRQYLDMFTTVLNNIGTEKYDKDKINTLLNLYTSGFNVSYETVSDKNDSTKVKNLMIFSISCIDRNIEKMVELFREVVCQPDFSDNDHIATVIKNTAAQLGQNIVDGSMSYAQSVANASLREKYFVNESLYQTRFLCNVGKNIGKNKLTQNMYMDDIRFQFESFVQYIFKKQKIEFMVHSDKQENLQEMRFQLTRLVDGFKFSYKSFEQNINDIDPYFNEENPNPFNVFHLKNYYQLPMQVNYVVQSLQIPHYNHISTPRLNLVSELLSNKVLHKEIREKGGAYGGGSKIGDGVLTFYSYRDPNTTKTLEAYTSAINQISDGNFDEQDIKDAKLSVFQKIDRVITPQNKGMGWFINGFEAQEKIQFRERLLSASKQELIQAAQEHLKEAHDKNQISRVIFGSDNDSQVKQFQENGWDIQKALKQD